MKHGRLSPRPGQQTSIRKPFFFEKKNQKTLVNLGHGGHHAPGPNQQKFFCFFFSKKEVLPNPP
jgi:hypothetical protein